MDWFHRSWRALKRKYGIFSPPTVYHLYSFPISGELTDVTHKRTDPWDRVTQKVHSFITETQKRISICSMTPEYNERIYTPDVITQLWDRIDTDHVDIRVVASPLTETTFENSDIEHRVGFDYPRDFILFDNSRSIIVRESRAYIYTTLDPVPTLWKQFLHLYAAAH